MKNINNTQKIYTLNKWLLGGSKGRAQRKGASVPFMYTLSMLKKMHSLISQQNIQIIIWFSKMRTHTSNI